MVDSYRSEVRDSEVAELLEKVRLERYEKYLRAMTLLKIRAFDSKRISFDFPVTAIVGPNGGGKTTVLGAAAIIYGSIAPRLFFAKSGKYDESMQEWSVDYEAIDRPLGRPRVIRRASFRQAKWNRNTLDRDVLVFGITRTVPASERRELVKAVGKGFQAFSENELEPAVAAAAGHVLGKTITGYQRLGVRPADKVTMYAASTSQGTYSEFHFGAGEASIIKIISGVESADKGSLILIEEIENGLHPVATQRLVEYLMRAALEKNVQVVFSTHSNDALRPLPNSGVWVAYNGELIQGKPDVRALRTLTGEVEAQLAIYVEDKFAELMVRAALRQPDIELDAIMIHGMGGESPARQVNKHHNLDPTRRFGSLCILDGDQEACPEKQEYRLPGRTYPENHVFEFVHSNLAEFSAKLAVMLHLRTSEQQWVREVVESRAASNLDRHLIFCQIGEDLHFISEEMVMNAFVTLWAQECSDEVQALVDQLRPHLPLRTVPASS